MKNLRLQFTEGITVEVPAAVVENREPFLFVGNDIVGGPTSLLRRVAMNEDYSFYTLVDVAAGVVGNV